MIWYSNNKDCDASNLKIILDSFKLENFSGKELLTVVKQSGLFSEEDIEKICIEKFERFEDLEDSMWGPPYAIFMIWLRICLVVNL